MKEIIILYSAISFFFNFIWEISQIELYKPHFEGFWDLIFVHVRAALGDVVIFLVIYVLMGIFLKNFYWIKKNKTKSILWTVPLGFIFAVAIEKYALLVGRWSYAEAMPVIPYLKVGLLPILQLMILVPLTIILTKKILIKRKIN